MDQIWISRGVILSALQKETSRRNCKGNFAGGDEREGGQTPRRLQRLEARVRMRGTNFDTTEEMQLCRSYVAIGTDAVTGTAQKSGTFWERIEKHFNDHTGGSERSLRSLETKWRVISAECSKFVGAMATMRALHRSGENEDDEIKRGMQVYATMVEDGDKENTGSKKKKSKPVFKLLHCWRILETEPKWKTFRDPKPSEDGDACQSDATRAPSSAPAQRPTGNKSAKEEAKNAAIMETTYKRIASATVQSARASAKRVKLMEGANNMALFTIPLGNLDPSAQRYSKCAVPRSYVRWRRRPQTRKSRRTGGEVEVVQPPETAPLQADDCEVVNVEEDRML